MPTFQNLPRFRAGQGLSEISARQLNALVDWIKPIGNIKGVEGSGILVKKTADTTTIDIRKESGGATGTEKKWVIVRDIPDPDDGLLIVEEAWGHPDFAGEEDPANRYLFIARSDYSEPPGEPDLLEMGVWPNWRGRHYELMRWPAVGQPTTRATHIMDAEFRDFGGGRTGWFVVPHWRMYALRANADAKVSSCIPTEGF